MPWFLFSRGYLQIPWWHSPIDEYQGCSNISLPGFTALKGIIIFIHSNQCQQMVVFYILYIYIYIYICHQARYEAEYCHLFTIIGKYENDDAPIFPASRTQRMHHGDLFNPAQLQKSLYVSNTKSKIIWFKLIIPNINMYRMSHNPWPNAYGMWFAWLSITTESTKPTFLYQGWIAWQWIHPTVLDIYLSIYNRACCSQ